MTSDRDHRTTLSYDETESLRPGANHYRAYIGPPKQWDFMGMTQIRLLATLGLRENDQVLDLGCGSLRAGRLLMMYLRSGRYHGIEPNDWLVQDAIEQEIGPEFIALKQPRFDNNSDFNTEVFDTKFDWIVAQSIFSHTGPRLIETALTSCKVTLNDAGLMLATFIHAEEYPSLEKELPGWTYPDCTTYDSDRVLELIQKAGFVGRALPWFHPRQTWYAIAHNEDRLPPPSTDQYLDGRVLSDDRFKFPEAN